MQELLADAKAKKFELVLVYKIDRFSRNLKDLLNLIDELSGYGVGFKSATEPFDSTTSAGKLMFQQLGSFAEFERNRISERVFPGMIKGVQSGNWQGARYSPFGYHYNKPIKLLEVAKDEAEIVRLIYKMYLENRSTSDIAHYLNKHGFKSRSGIKFYTKFIGDVLKNRIYTGQLIWNQKHYDKNQKTKKHYKYIKNDPSKVIITQGKHQPIITIEDFEKVQALIAGKKLGWRPRVKSKEYLLGGILTCSKCSHSYTGLSSISNHRTMVKKRWYRCSGPYASHVRCSNRSVKAREIEAETEKAIEVLIKNKRFQNSRWLTGTRGFEADSQIFAENPEKTKNKLLENQAKQTKLTDAYLDNMLGEDVYRGMINGLRKEEDDVKKSLASIEFLSLQRESSEGYLNRVKDFLESSNDNTEEVSFTDKKEMCGLLFKNITIAPPIGNARLENRLKFNFFEPFESIFKEAKELKTSRKNLCKITPPAEKSTSRHSADRWCKYRVMILGIVKRVNAWE